MIVDPVKPLVYVSPYAWIWAGSRLTASRDLPGQPKTPQLYTCLWPYIGSLRLEEILHRLDETDGLVHEGQVAAIR